MRIPMTEAGAGHGLMRGQSTVEFVVLASVLVPLFLIVPLIGKYLDIAQTTASASRYVAFEGMVHHSSSLHPWKSDTVLANEVRRRFFSNSDAPVKSGDVAGDFNGHRNALWFDHRGQALLPAFASNIGATSERNTLTQPLGALFASTMGLSTRNLHTGAVRVNIADVAGLAPFDALGLSIRRHTTILADTWAASGPAAVSSAIRNDGLNPAGHFPFRPLEMFVTGLVPLVEPLRFVLPDANLPNIGRVDPDIVPADRIR